MSIDSTCAFENCSAKCEVHPRILKQQKVPWYCALRMFLGNLAKRTYYANG